MENLQNPDKGAEVSEEGLTLRGKRTGRGQTKMGEEDREKREMGKWMNGALLRVR